MNALDFKGRTAVITGGAQGIGFTVAKQMIAGGARVALWDRDKAALEKAVAELGEENAIAIEVDIGNYGDVETQTSNSIKHLGKIDILINNAAIVGPNLKLWEYPIEDFSDVVQVGLIGTFYVSRAVVPHMRKQGYGRIVNVSSIAGKEGNPNASAYSSAKAGVIAMTKSLGKELADLNIAVNCVTPAVAKTKLAMMQSEKHLEYIISKIPRGRMLQLQEASEMICWLSTQENSFTTAAVFDLSGGRATY
ncbi:MAG: SDR family oxidoreductase [Kordiimonadaceae bacterium]|jgi:2-dehydro-3-deoxy-L-rhamnonate dehydrogenase (NAD+)|nr:SDR family oxidoreductase [Kordiimonadaceae bacterium]MBT6330183.1 SDR family oxidoreductase [Kordiimonadaceae bacterium]